MLYVVFAVKYDPNYLEADYAGLVGFKRKRKISLESQLQNLDDYY